MEIKFTDSIDSIDPEEWSSIINSDYPFLKHSFFNALEKSGCIGPESGWNPFYLLLYNQEKLSGIMPLFLKTNSSGEFVFDWSWADAFYRHGLPYYPKLVCSIPFTPASGPRLSLINGLDRTKAIKFIIKEVKNLSDKIDISSFHILFPNNKEKKEFTNSGLRLRTSNSFHWFNNKYKNFDNFLNDFTSRQRKNLKKERSKIDSQGITMEKVQGNKITAKMWDNFYSFYQRTYYIRGSKGYLNLNFFKLIGKLMPEALLMILAKNSKGEYVAAALNFLDKESLYGRYWGSLEDYDSLHFETCYYQGIEYCIKNGLHRFDPGVQGEHKIKRGFCPIETYSLHWIKDEKFKGAIDNFLSKEKKHIQSYNKSCIELLPFKESITKDIYKNGYNIRSRST